MLKYTVEYNNTAIIGDKEFKFRPWTTKNEKDYLIAVESEENITDKILYDILIRPCLEDPDVNLTTNEQKMLIIEIRKKSLGSTFPMRYACTSCNQVNDIDVNFDSIVKFKPDDFYNVTIDGIIFEFGNILSENLKSKLDNVSSKVEYAFIEFLLHIHSITIAGVKEDTFTYDELKDYVESLPTQIFDEAFTEFNKMKSDLTFELNTFCLACNAENEVDFGHIPNFLWT